MDLPIHLNKRNDHPILSSIQLRKLYPNLEQHFLGVPWLYGEVSIVLPQPIHLGLQIYNRAGIPIIEGETKLEMGQKRVVFQTLRPLGIEAYAHASDSERVEIGRRMWSRAVYGKLVILSDQE